MEDGTVSSKVPGLYLQLKRSMKHAQKDDLKRLFDELSSQTLCSKRANEKLTKLYLDACAMAASDGCIGFLDEVIGSGQAPEETVSKFNLYTAFAAHPGPLALAAVKNLISRSDADHEHLLMSSGLAHQYCKMSNPDCGSNDEYISLVNKIVQHVRPATDEESMGKVIAALQALGNLDNFTPAAVTAVSGLIKDTSMPERLQVRALDSFRRDPCQPQLKGLAKEVLEDLKRNSNVRIQAYLTLTKCLHIEDVPYMQAILDNEKSNQGKIFF